MPGYTVGPLSPNDAELLDKAFGVKDSTLEYNPGKCLLPPHHERICQQIIDAPVRPDDIWLVSFPRTGSTWCQEMIWLLGNNLDYDGAKSKIQQLRAPLIEMSTVLAHFQDCLGALVENSVDYINKMPSPRYIKSHIPLPLLPSQLAEVKPKIIYTARNPKDQCVSYYYHCKMIHNLAISFDEFSELLMKGLTPYGPVLSHYLAFWKKRNEPNVLFLKYEDMKADMRGTLKLIASFLGKEYTELEYDGLCEFLSFKKMRENKGCNLEDLLNEQNGKDFFRRAGAHFIRKGVVGDWKNHMSEELAAKFDAWVEGYFRGTGLAFD